MNYAEDNPTAVCGASRPWVHSRPEQPQDGRRTYKPRETPLSPTAKAVLAALSDHVWKSKAELLQIAGNEDRLEQAIFLLTSRVPIAEDDYGANFVLLGDDLPIQAPGEERP